MWFVVVILVAGYLWWKHKENKLDRQAEETVRTTSTKYEELKELTQNLILNNIVIDRSYQFFERFKQRLENFDANRHMTGIVATNVGNFATVAQALADNNARYNEYNTKFAEILRRNTQYFDDVRLQAKEAELCNRLKRYYCDEKFFLTLTVFYVSPKGRNRYSKDFTFDFDDLCRMIKIVRPEWQLKREVVGSFCTVLNSLLQPNPVQDGAGKNPAEVSFSRSDSTVSLDDEKNETKKKVMNYEVMNYGSYKGKPITWLVVQTIGETKILVSEKIIDVQKFHFVCKNIDWHQSSLCRWLQTTFYNEAFSDEEKKKLKPFTNVADENIHQIIQEYVTLPSVEQVKQYFRNDEVRRCEVTDYAKERGVGCYPETSLFGQWWTRTLAKEEFCLVYVSPSGKLIDNNMPFYWQGLGVRPMIFIDGKNNYGNRGRVEPGKSREEVNSFETEEIPKKFRLEITNYKPVPEVKLIEDSLKHFCAVAITGNDAAKKESMVKLFGSLINGLKKDVELWTIIRFTPEQWKAMFNAIRTGEDANPLQFSKDILYLYSENGYYVIPLFTNPMAAEDYHADKEMCTSVNLLLKPLLKNKSFADKKFAGFMLMDRNNNYLINENLRNELFDFLKKRDGRNDERDNRGKNNEGLICDKCNIVYANTFKFCPECGSPLRSRIDYTKCASCGYDVKKSMKFCPKCGNKLHRSSKNLK